MPPRALRPGGGTTRGSRRCGATAATAARHAIHAIPPMGPAAATTAAVRPPKRRYAIVVSVAHIVGSSTSPVRPFAVTCHAGCFTLARTRWMAGTIAPFNAMPTVAKGMSTTLPTASRREPEADPARMESRHGARAVDSEQGKVTSVGLDRRGEPTEGVAVFASVRFDRGRERAASALRSAKTGSRGPASRSPRMVIAAARSMTAASSHDAWFSVISRNRCARRSVRPRTATGPSAR